MKSTSKFIPYGKQWLDKNDIQAVVNVLNSDFLTQGPKIEQFEKDICKYTGAKYCIAVANGTAALHLAVAALNLPKYSHGLTSPISFLASANCLIYNNLKPIFADINLKDFNISANTIEAKITPTTKVIISVHFAGQPCNMKAIHKLAKEKKTYVIEDAAHAIGSKYSDGSKIGNCKYSDMTIFSFHPVKTITTGEGGAITTNDHKLYKKLINLRSHGVTKIPDEFISKDKENGPWYYEMQKLGFNYRLTDLQAALGSSQLNKIDTFIEKRRNIIKKYNNAFKDISWLTTPKESPGLYSAFHLYILLFNFKKIKKSRKNVMELLSAKNIGTQVHYIPIHLQPFYQKNFGYKNGDFPIAEEYYTHTLSLPLYPKMTEKEIDYVIANVINLEK
jgi:UDP-4-amino-4,6-dideoxy-N-acetyl-beta-L-altrosamine transaminase